MKRHSFEKTIGQFKTGSRCSGLVVAHGQQFSQLHSVAFGASIGRNGSPILG